MSPYVAVVKVGGSLYDLPDLGVRLRRWLAEQFPDGRVVLVPGGGPSADVVRHLDHRHALGEEISHWLALRALTLNAHFLAALLPLGCVTGDTVELQHLWRKNRLPILDVHEFARTDEPDPNHLPHSWTVTSDAFAARIAILVQASHLVLLKSTEIAQGLEWAEAGRMGFVDPMFAQVLRNAPAELCVFAVNLRKEEG
jgi:aspartokinase-like uncharacterized kinase